MPGKYGQDGGGDLELFVSWFPKPLAPVLRTGVHALLDPPLLAALGFPPAPGRVVAAADRALRVRARVVRGMPPRQGLKPARAHSTVKGYPNGYVIEQLGTG